MRIAFGRIVREPLVHFVVAGIVLVGLYSAIRGPADGPLDDRTISVDRNALLTYMQYRANAFEPDTFGSVLDSMSDDELSKLIDAYVREEIKFREARALGLMSGDYVIRQRMVQKIDFLFGDLAAAGVDDDEADLRSYFEAHKDDYAIEGSVTFTHVFLDADRRGTEQAHADAQALALELNAAGAEFSDAAGFGDRFPYLRNYVDRTSSFVESHFGSEFATAIMALPVEPQTWQGPIRSAYGEHLALITRRTERRIPPFEQVRDLVREDFVRARTATEQERMVDGLRSRYRVEIGDVREHR